MASLRKRYRPESGDADKEFPVQTAPTTVAEPPPITDKQEPAEPLEQLKESNAVEEAAQHAIKQRLREMEAAESLQREAVSLQQRMAKSRESRRRLLKCLRRCRNGWPRIPNTSTMRWPKRNLISRP